MKKIWALIFLLFLIPSILAINVKVEKTSQDETLVIGINQPLIINTKITNNGAADDFMFYSFFGADFYPKGTVRIEAGETKEVEIKIYPREDFEQRGHITFDYFIKSQDGTEQKESVTIRVVDLDDCFKITSDKITPDKNSIKVYVKNTANFNFNSVKANFSSLFFEDGRVFDLASYEEKEFEIFLNKEFEEVQAGFYTIKTEINVDNKKADIESSIEFAENNIVTTEEKKFGLIVNSYVIKKVNEGNVISKSETNIKKNIISRIFTNFNPEPDVIERRGFSVYYTWENQIKPGQEIEIVAKTNWLFPFLIILFIFSIIIFARQFSKTNLTLRKKICFVRAKGGEFALKVSIFVQARKYIERIKITDRLPALVKVHEKFGLETPSRVTEKAIEWNYEKLEEGEVRVLSYIIYSKVGVIGKFALPTALAVYDREGRIRESQSNRVFFVAEQAGE